MKSNLEHSVLPTAKEIRLYHEGQLAPHRSHEIEVLAQENPLLAEALEGFSATPAYTALPAINAAIAQSVRVAGTRASAAASLVGASTPWWHLNGWIIGLVIGSAVAIGTTFLISRNDYADQKIASNSNTGALTTPMTDVVQKNSGEIPSIISEKPAVVHPAILNTKKLSANTIVSERDVLPSESEESIPLLETTTNEKSKKVILATAIKENPTPKKSSTVAIKIMHILNYKLADYTEIRSTQWEKFALDDVGLPANFSSFEERNTYLYEHPEKATPYVEYISQCIKAFDEAKYKLTIQRFNVVLNEYPDDVNAQFYSAMSFFHTEEYEKAIALFSKSEKNMIKTFNEESLFYHAKSLKALGLVDEANALFTKVVQKNGFYAANALKEISSEK